jgi:hypothetical protein
MNRIGLSLVLVLAVATNGCWLGRKKPQTTAVPPPPAPVSTPSSKTKTKTKPIDPPSVTLPEKPVGSLPDMPPVQSENTPAETPPPKPVTKPGTRKSAKKAPPAAPPVTATVPPATTSPTPATVPATVPQLAVLLTPEQRNQFEADYSRDMASAMDGLIHVLETSLTPAQKESMTRVRSFMRQAEDAHGRDLATAAQLARRAAVLAQDLVQSQH